MKDREFKAYLQGSMKKGENGHLEKIRETVAGCKEIMQRQRVHEEEKRTGFWQFLSDVFRFEGLSIFGLQAGVLILVCLQIGIIENVSNYIPAFTTLFALAVMPVLLRSQFYNMGEMEAVTRASGAEIILAKLILAGAANLVCITILFCLIMHLENLSESMGQIVLYGLVPYLVCMTAILRLIRLRRKERIPFCIVAPISFWFCCGISARAFPQVYEPSATGLWIILFLIFAGFFGKEIALIRKMRKEGKQYGIIG
ncbi:MAG: hypothetical protein K2O59_05990 [Lachnospiraceae bacterium]|nr:hypothetical protein [Lachnospiraceae bacterium]